MTHQATSPNASATAAPAQPAKAKKKPLYKRFFLRLYAMRLTLIPALLSMFSLWIADITPVPAEQQLPFNVHLFVILLIAFSVPLRAALWAVIVYSIVSVVFGPALGVVTPEGTVGYLVGDVVATLFVGWTWRKYAGPLTTVKRGALAIGLGFVAMIIVSTIGTSWLNRVTGSYVGLVESATMYVVMNVLTVVLATVIILLVDKLLPADKD